MFRYAHTNMIARDHKKLIAFYKAVFHCRSIGETRDLRGGVAGPADRAFRRAHCGGAPLPARIRGGSSDAGNIFL